MSAPDPMVHVRSPGWDPVTAQALLDACDALDVPQDTVGCYSDGYAVPKSVADQAALGYCLEAGV